MRSPFLRSIVYLAFSFLGPAIAQNIDSICKVSSYILPNFKTPNSLHLPPPTQADPGEQVPDGCTSYRSLDALNAQLQLLLQDVAQTTSYFGYFRIDLDIDCPLWEDPNPMCGNRACAVETIDDESFVPNIWLTPDSADLCSIRGPKVPHPDSPAPSPSPLSGALGPATAETCIIEPDEDCSGGRDYCIPLTGGTYVSLLANPERYTDYNGTDVWRELYGNACFDNNECPEKRIFYRIISGFHSSVAAHLCWDYQPKGAETWSPDLDCFINRLGSHPHRMRNLYFNHALLLRAVQKLHAYIPEHSFCTAADAGAGLATRTKLQSLADAIPADVFDETVMFRDDSALKEEFRNRFRKVSRAMDCVTCERCKLWGKVQTQGYGTALKVLLEMDGAEQGNVLRRTEMVALVNTLDRVAHALDVVGRFQNIWAEKNATEAGAAAAAVGKPAAVRTALAHGGALIKGADAGAYGAL